MSRIRLLKSIPGLVGTLAALVLAQSVCSQVNWALRSPSATPPVRLGHAMAFDSLRGQTVLFGGVDAAAVNFGDTWEWDGVAWTQKVPTSSPAPRRRPAMAFDSVRGVSVLYGGYSGWFNYAETWEWDGTQWTLRTTAANPGPRDSHAMAFDSARGRVVLFGGSIGTTVNDTWEYDGLDWKAVAPTTSPSARTGHHLAYDVARAKVVLFGGIDPGLNRLDDTWEWDGIDWTLVVPVAKPPARFNAGMAYDVARARVVLFGGSTTAAHLADTWEYDGVTWMQRTSATSPGPTAYQEMVYDSLRGMTVMFGGGTLTALVPDTWEYFPIAPASTEVFGVPCPLGMNEPRIGATLPWLGYELTTTVQGLLPMDAVLLIIGNSKSAWEGNPLPIDLTYIGMSACSLYTNPMIELPLVTIGSQAKFSILVQEIPDWIGFSLYHQAFVLRPGANVLGVVASAAVATTFGGK